MIASGRPGSSRTSGSSTMIGWNGGIATLAALVGAAAVFLLVASPAAGAITALDVDGTGGAAAEVSVGDEFTITATASDTDAWIVASIDPDSTGGLQFLGGSLQGTGANSNEATFRLRATGEGHAAVRISDRAGGESWLALIVVQPAPAGSGEDGAATDEDDDNGIPPLVAEADATQVLLVVDDDHRTLAPGDAVPFEVRLADDEGNLGWGMTSVLVSTTRGAIATDAACTENRSNAHQLDDFVGRGHFYFCAPDSPGHVVLTATESPAFHELDGSSITLTAGDPATTPPDPDPADDPADPGEIDAPGFRDPVYASGITLNVFTGVSLAELEWYARLSDLRSLWVTDDGEWLGLVVDAPEFVNEDFYEYFVDGFSGSQAVVILR